MARKKMVIDAGIPAVPPETLNPDEVTAFHELRAQVVNGGYESVTPRGIFMQGVEQRGRLISMRRELDEMSTNGKWISPKGGLNPLVREIRQLESVYTSTLGKLLLTTRSAASTRAKPDERKIDDFGDGSDPLLKLLG